MNIAELIESIKAELDDCYYPPEALPYQLRQILGEPIEEDRPPVSEVRYTQPDNPFQIEKTRVLQIDCAEELEKEMALITEISELQALIDQYGGGDPETNLLCACIQILEKAVSDIQKKKRPAFKMDKTADELAKWMKKRILVNAGKLSEALYKVYLDGKLDSAPGFRDILETVNRYLQKIGVYTFIARRGELFENDIMDCYDPPYGETVTKPPEIQEVERPAYVLEYMEDDEPCRVVLPGKCRFSYKKK